MNPSCASSSRRGMVLFELMIALFVFTVVAFSLVLALDAAMKAARERSEIATVVNGLDGQLAQLHQGNIAPCDKDLPPDGTGVTYHLTIAPEPMKDQKHQLIANIYRATLTAKWETDGQPEDRSIDELIYQP